MSAGQHEVRQIEMPVVRCRLFWWSERRQLKSCEVAGEAARADNQLRREVENMKREKEKLAQARGSEGKK